LLAIFNAVFADKRVGSKEVQLSDGMRFTVDVRWHDGLLYSTKYADIYTSPFLPFLSKKLARVDLMTVEGSPWLDLDMPAI
jgi:hypothetical protein